MDASEVIKNINTLGYEDLTEIFNDLADQFMECQGCETLAEPLKSIANAISKRITSGSWNTDCITTAFWVLSKAVLIPDSPDLVQLASNAIKQINTADSCYQVLIALDNQMMAERVSDKNFASIILAEFDNSPSLWNEDPQLLGRVRTWLEKFK